MLETDPTMRDLAYIIGRRHIPMDDIRYYIENPYVMSFVYRAMQDAEKDQRNWLEKALGIRVSAELIHAWAGNGSSSSNKSNQAKPDHAYIPMLMALAGKEFFKHIAESVRIPDDSNPLSIAQGDYHPVPDDGKIISMRDADKAEWMTFMRNTGIYDPAVMDKAVDRARKESDGQSSDAPHIDGGGFEDNTSKEDHIAIIQKALGVSPLVSPTKGDKFKK